jgi:hypothetical protein
MPMRLWVGTGFDRYAQELSLVSGALGQVDWYARFGMPAAGRRMSDVVTCWPAQVAGAALNLRLNGASAAPMPILGRRVRCTRPFRWRW